MKGNNNCARSSKKSDTNADTNGDKPRSGTDESSSSVSLEIENKVKGDEIISTLSTPPIRQQRNRQRKDVNKAIPSMVPVITEKNELEMKRDREYRLLNEKLREKEYRLKELEAGKIQQDELAAQLAKKIEKEVIMKLAQASTLSHLLLAQTGTSTVENIQQSASKQTSVNVDNSGNHSVAKESKRKQRIERPLNTNQKSESQNGKPLSSKESAVATVDQSGGSKRAERGKGGGGLLKVPWLGKDEESSTEPLPSTLPPPPHLQQSGKGQTNAIGSTKRSAPPAPETEALRTKRLEASFQHTIEGLRKDPASLVDYCVLGPSSGSPELHRIACELENQYLTAIRASPVTASSAGLANRLWALRHRQLELFISTLSGKSGGPKLDSAALLQVQKTYLSELKAAEAAVERTVAVLQGALSSLRDRVSAPASTSAYATCLCLQSPDALAADDSLAVYAAVCEALQCMHTARGDLLRYQQQLRPPNALTPPDMAEVWNAYRQASEAAPWNGTARKAMGLVCRAQGDVFGTVYNLFRSQCTRVPYQARETLLGMFENERMATEDLEPVNALSALSLTQHRERFLRHFLACLGITYSRAGADKFIFHQDRARRHLANVLQGAAVSSTAGVTASAGGGRDRKFLQLTKAGFESPAAMGTQLSAGTTELLATVASDLSRSLQLCIAVTHVIVEKHALLADVNACAMDPPVTLGAGDNNGLDAVEEEMRPRRCTAKCLHVVQRVPGLMDIWRLSVGLLCTAMAAEGPVSGTVMPSVSLFLGWLKHTPTIHSLTIADRHSWQQFENALTVFIASCANFLRGKAKGLATGRLPEDLGLVGFVPVVRCGGFPSACPCIGQTAPLPEQAEADESEEESVVLSTHFHRIKDLVMELGRTPVAMGSDRSVVFRTDNLYAMTRPTPSVSGDTELGQWDESVMVLSVVLPKASTAKLTDRVTVVRGFDTVAPKILSPEDAGRILKAAKKPIATAAADEAEASTEADEAVGVAGDKEVDVTWQSAVVAVASLEIDTDKNDENGSQNVATAAPKGMLRVEIGALLAGTGSGRVDREENQNVSDNGGRNRRAKGGASRSERDQHYRAAPSSMSALGDPPVVVVDAPNVAMRHGLNLRFSSKGVQLALDFFIRAGHKVVAFLPDYYLNYEDVNALRRQGNLNMSGAKVRASRVPDDVGLLQELVGKGCLICTPAQDYDDSYSINYAKRHDGYVVTNDMYRDHVERQDKKVKEETRKWLKAHSISYTFVGDEFLPNPDAAFANAGTKVAGR